MNTNLQNILEYQKVDIELRKLMDEIDRNEDNKNLELTKQEFNAAKIAVADSERDAGNIVDFYTSSLAYLEDNEQEIETITTKLDTCSDGERGELVEKLESLKDKFSDLERRLADKRDKSDKIIRAYLDAQDKGKKMRERYNTVKHRLDEFKKAREPRINQLTAALNSLLAAAPKDLMEVYVALTSEHKIPAFVPAMKTDDKKNYRCFCGLTLSQKTKGELLESGYCRCETCRRVIYMEAK